MICSKKLSSKSHTSPQGLLSKDRTLICGAMDDNQCQPYRVIRLYWSTGEEQNGPRSWSTSWRDHLFTAEKLVVCKPSMGRIALANGKHKKTGLRIGRCLPFQITLEKIPHVTDLDTKRVRTRTAGVGVVHTCSTRQKKKVVLARVLSVTTRLGITQDVQDSWDASKYPFTPADWRNRSKTWWSKIIDNNLHSFQPRHQLTVNEFVETSTMASSTPEVQMQQK